MEIIKINSNQKSAFLQNLTKAYTEGIYSDTPANRKLGRVGMSYKEWTSKQQGGKISEEPKEKKDNGNNGGGDWRNGLDEGTVEEIEQLVLSYQREGSEDKELYDARKRAVAELTSFKKADEIFKKEGIKEPKSEKNVKVKKGNFAEDNLKSENSKAVVDNFNKDASRLKKYLGDKNLMSIDKDGKISINDIPSANELNKIKGKYLSERELGALDNLQTFKTIFDGENINNLNIDLFKEAISDDYSLSINNTEITGIYCFYNSKRDEIKRFFSEEKEKIAKNVISSFKEKFKNMNINEKNSFIRSCFEKEYQNNLNRYKKNLEEAIKDNDEFDIKYYKKGIERIKGDINELKNIKDFEIKNIQLGSNVDNILINAKGELLIEKTESYITDKKDKNIFSITTDDINTKTISKVKKELFSE